MAVVLRYLKDEPVEAIVLPPSEARFLAEMLLKAARIVEGDRR